MAPLGRGPSKSDSRWLWFTIEIRERLFRLVGYYYYYFLVFYIANFLYLSTSSWIRSLVFLNTSIVYFYFSFYFLHISISLFIFSIEFFNISTLYSAALRLYSISTLTRSCVDLSNWDCFKSWVSWWSYYLRDLFSVDNISERSLLLWRNY